MDDLLREDVEGVAHAGAFFHCVPLCTLLLCFWAFGERLKKRRDDDGVEFTNADLVGQRMRWRVRGAVGNLGCDSIHSIWGREHTRKDRLNCTWYGNIFKRLRT